MQSINLRLLTADIFVGLTMTVVTLFAVKKGLPVKSFLHKFPSLLFKSSDVTKIILQDQHSQDQD